MKQRKSNFISLALFIFVMMQFIGKIETQECKTDPKLTKYDRVSTVTGGSCVASEAPCDSKYKSSDPANENLDCNECAADHRFDRVSGQGRQCVSFQTQCAAGHALNGLATDPSATCVLITTANNQQTITCLAGYTPSSRAVTATNTAFCNQCDPNTHRLNQASNTGKGAACVLKNTQSGKPCAPLHRLNRPEADGICISTTTGKCADGYALNGFATDPSVTCVAFITPPDADQTITCLAGYTPSSRARTATNIVFCNQCTDTYRLNQESSTAQGAGCTLKTGPCAPGFRLDQPSSNPLAKCISMTATPACATNHRLNGINTDPEVECTLSSSPFTCNPKYQLISNSCNTCLKDYILDQVAGTIGASCVPLGSDSCATGYRLDRPHTVTGAQCVAAVSASCQSQYKATSTKSSCTLCSDGNRYDRPE
jgi:hypothetical protein